MSQPLADRIDAILPQTQCGQCGYHGCRPYAEAMAENRAPLNRCPPGGTAGIAKLAALLGRETLPLDTRCGEEKPRQLAYIVEAECIGCTKCIQACPVDAIIGASRLMHTVLREDCTGCELCLPACPVDCIEFIPMPVAQQDRVHADAARVHFRRRERRLAAQHAQRERDLAERKRQLAAVTTTHLSPVQAALARARQRSSKPSP